MKTLKQVLQYLESKELIVDAKYVEQVIFTNVVQTFKKGGTFVIYNLVSLQYEPPKVKKNHFNLRTKQKEDIKTSGRVKADIAKKLQDILKDMV